AAPPDPPSFQPAPRWPAARPDPYPTAGTRAVPGALRARPASAAAAAPAEAVVEHALRARRAAGVLAHLGGRAAAHQRGAGFALQAAARAAHPLRRAAHPTPTRLILRAAPVRAAHLRGGARLALPRTPVARFRCRAAGAPAGPLRRARHARPAGDLA